MHKRIVFYTALLLSALLQPAFAQETAQEDLALALSQDEDFRDFYLENLRFLIKRENDAITEEEKTLFREEQKQRVDNIKARFPQLTAMSEDSALLIRQRAWDIVKVLHKEEIEQLQQTGKQ